MPEPLHTDWAEYSNRICEIRRKLEALNSKSMLLRLEIFEGLLTLQELEECITLQSDAKGYSELAKLFASRWERIRGTNLCYTVQPTQLVNQLCLDIAKKISPSIKDESDIEKLKDKEGPFCLLMPSIENAVTVHLDNIHSFPLNGFILSDNQQVFIPILRCLENASQSDEGHLQHMVLINDQIKLLTPSEIRRLSNHSYEAKTLYNAVIEYNKHRLFTGLGGKLKDLVKALRAGGASAGGSEYNAGVNANEGILAFYQYWESLPSERKDAIYKEYSGLERTLSLLFRPKELDFTGTRFCVELLADSLDPIAGVCSRVPYLEQQVLKAKGAFEKVLRDVHSHQIHQNLKEPRNILHRIYALSAEDQEVMFAPSRCKDALMYALFYAPDAMPLFEEHVLPDQKSILATMVNSKKESVLVIAVKAGALEAVDLLLRWGASLESRDNMGRTALHWSVTLGYTKIAEHLLAQGADINALDLENNTALHFAIDNNNTEMVQLLIKQGAKINLRNHQGRNAFNISRGELRDLIFLQSVGLSLEEQHEFFLNIFNGSHRSNLAFIYPFARSDIRLFDKFIKKLDELPDERLKMDTLSLLDRYGQNLAHHAAILGSLEGLKMLIERHVDINKKSTQGKSPLHKAIIHEHYVVACCLIDRGAVLDDSDEDGHTPLHMAVKTRQPKMVELLLQNGAGLVARNAAEKNALEIAVEVGNREVLKLILLKMVTLPILVQEDCLLNVKNRAYPNALLYVAEHDCYLFAALLDKILTFSDDSLKNQLLNSLDANRLSPAIWAIKQGSNDILKKLLASGMIAENQILNLLHWALVLGKEDIATDMIEQGADIQLVNTHGKTPLILAVKANSGNMVNLLLKKGAHLNPRDKEGMSALDWAIKNQTSSILPILQKIATLPVDEQAACLINVPNGPYEKVVDYVSIEMPTLSAFFITEPEPVDGIKDTLTRMHFNEHIQNIVFHYQKMKDKSRSNSKYKEAILATKMLLLDCMNAKKELVQHNDPTKILEFQVKCKSAIQNARGILEKHRGWKRVLRIFLMAVTFPFSLPLYGLGVFSLKTTSSTLADKFEEDLYKKRISPSGDSVG